jgi:alkane 1-monooxygenase
VHLGMTEIIVLFFGMGVVSGTIGINYSHELMHQKPAIERLLADLLLASVLYGHFRSEHLRVHHLYVGTARDPVTARYNEGFHRFFPRVVPQCFMSALRAEAAMLARRGLPPEHRSNPFWRYLVLQVGMLVLAYLWPDAPAFGGRKVRTCSAPPFVERRPSRVELAVDQPAAPF